MRRRIRRTLNKLIRWALEMPEEGEVVVHSPMTEAAAQQIAVMVSGELGRRAAVRFTTAAGDQRVARI